jgi:hypothetical protein
LAQAVITRLGGRRVRRRPTDSIIRFRFSDADAERWLDVAAPQVANRRRDSESDSPNFQTPIDVRSESIPAMMVRIRILHEGR